MHKIHETEVLNCIMNFPEQKIHQQTSHAVHKKTVCRPTMT